MKLLRAIVEILRRMTTKLSYENAKRRSLARRPFLKTDGQYATRAEVHERELFRRGTCTKLGRQHLLG
jgi:hypothetical protein